MHIKNLKSLIAGNPNPLEENTMMFRHDKLSSCRHLFGEKFHSLAKRAIMQGDRAALDDMKTIFKDIVSETEKGFLSTSYKNDVFLKEPGFEMIILTPKGYKKGLFIEQRSAVPGEREFLMAPGLKVRIISIEILERRGYKQLSITVSIES
jgi:hypothetical protein